MQVLSRSEYIPSNEFFRHLKECKVKKKEGTLYHLETFLKLKYLLRNPESYILF